MSQRVPAAASALPAVRHGRYFIRRDLLTRGPYDARHIQIAGC